MNTERDEPHEQKELSRALSRALFSVSKDRSEVLEALAGVEAQLFQAFSAVVDGKVDEARYHIKSACDREFKILGCCESGGMLSEAIATALGLPDDWAALDEEDDRPAVQI